jgi:response regulator of citrate/malate metabolism
VTIQVLIVEDDIRVANVHADFVRRVPGFAVAGIAHTATDARARLDELKPDLVLLDNYLPGESGLLLLNYLVKPFDADDLAERLVAYARYHAQLSPTGRTASQADIDRAVRLLHERDRKDTPKGRSAVTAQLIVDGLREYGQPASAAEVAAQLGIARATAQRYLTALTQDGSATMKLRYGATGRPEHEYQWVGDQPSG